MMHHHGLSSASAKEGGGGSTNDNNTTASNVNNVVVSHHYWRKVASFPCNRTYTIDGSNGDDALEESSEEGLLFVKVQKCASSTSAGINMRFARRYAAALMQKQEHPELDTTGGVGNVTVHDGKSKNVYSAETTSSCMHSSSHRRGREFRNRDRERSFLWSMVREPTSRHVSRFFHVNVGRRNVTPTDDNFLSQMEATEDDYMSNYLVVDGHDRAAMKDATLSTSERVGMVLRGYDFVGLVERLDESLVALQMLLGVTTDYVLHLSSKVNGGYDDGYALGGCSYIPPSFVSDAMGRYFESEGWRGKKNGLDYALWRAVNRSLDETIEVALGRAAFDEQFAEYKRMMEVAERRCLSRAVFPCTAPGLPNKKSKESCYYNDWGCGYKCIDALQQ